MDNQEKIAALTSIVDECTRSLGKAFYLSANGYEARRSLTCQQIQLIQKNDPTMPTWIPCKAKRLSTAPFKKNQSRGK